MNRPSLTGCQDDARAARELRSPPSGDPKLVEAVLPAVVKVQTNGKAERSSVGVARRNAVGRSADNARSPGTSLQEAIEELPVALVNIGPVRVGVSGNGWRRVRKLVAEFQPQTPEDWEICAAWVLDDSTSTRRRRRPLLVKPPKPRKSLKSILTTKFSTNSTPTT